MQSTDQQPPYRAQRFKMNRLTDARVAALETDMKFVLRDLSEVRTDVRDIRERVGSVETKLGILTERVDSLSAHLTDRMDSVSASLTDRMDLMSTNLTEKMESLSAITSEKLDRFSEKLDRFPTKLQLSLWACAGLIALLGVTASMIAVLLRLAGMNDAAAVVNAVSGK